MLRAKFIKYIGFCGVLIFFAFLKFLFPTVMVASQNKNQSISEYGDIRETFHLNRYYAPFFRLDGEGLSPFKSYFFNSTDSVLAIYPTKYYGENPKSLGDLSSYKFIDPGNLIQWSERFHFIFETPSIIYVKHRYLPEEKWVWTLDRKESALNDRNLIEIDIEMNKVHEENKFKFKLEYNDLPSVHPKVVIHEIPEPTVDIPPAYIIDSISSVILESAAREAAEKARKYESVIVLPNIDYENLPEPNLDNTIEELSQIEDTLKEPENDY